EKFWPYILAAVVIGGVYVYWKDLEADKKQLQTIQIVQEQARQVVIKKDTAITNEHANVLAQKNAVIDAQQTKIQELINANKDLHSIVVTYAMRQLLNGDAVTQPVGKDATA